MSDQITNLPLSAIEEDPDNTRKTYNPIKLQELADSISAQGVMQPVVVRPLYPNGDAPLNVSVRYRMVFGHRRFRASNLAGLEWIPTIIREMTAEEAAVAQLIENAQRDDVTALEEARGFERLITEFGVTVKQLIERTGKSKSYVYARLKLLHLTDTPRQALEAGQIDAEVAGLISRLPAAVQADALDEVLIDVEPGKQQSMSYREAKTALRHLIVDLADAPFPVDVVGLAEKPACHDCGDRAGNDPAMSDLEPMSCTRRACYTSKCHAWVQHQVNQAKAAGRRVIEGEEALAATRYGTYNLQGWAAADSEEWVSQGERMTARQLLQATGHDVQTALLVIPAERGTPRLIEVIDAKARAEAMHAYIASKKPTQGASGDDDAPEAGNWHSQRNNERDAILAQLTLAERCAMDEQHWPKVLEAIASRVRHTTRTLDDLRLLVQNGLDLGAELDDSFVARAFGWADRFAGMDDDEQAVASTKIVESLGPDDLAAILILWTLHEEQHLSWRALESVDAARTAAMHRLALARRYDVDVMDPEELEPPAEPVQTPAQVGDLFDAAPTPSTAGARAKKAATATAVKYRCPDTGATWTGRGLKPAWLRAKLEAGAALEDFEVKPAKGKDQTDKAGSAGNEQTDGAGVAAGELAEVGAE